MRKLVYGLTGAVVLLAAVVLGLPSLIDWNAWKPELSAKMKELTGRTLEVHGDLSFSVLPSLHLAADDVRVSNAPGAQSADMVALHTLKVSVDLAPLLMGRIEVAKIELVQPVIELERLAGGQANWTLGAGDTGIDSGRDGAREQAAPELTAAGSARAFRLENLSIRGGTIHYRDSAKGTVQSVRDLSADIAMDSLAGPFRVKGGMTARGLPLTFDGNVGRYVEGTPLAFALELGIPDASEVSAKGVVTGLGDVPALTADIRGGGRSLRSLIAALPNSATPRTLDAPDHPFALTASLAATREAIRLTDLTVELGGASASGSANVVLGSTVRADVEFKADRIDADAFLTPAAARSRTTDAGDGAGKEGADSGKAAAAGIRFPDDIDVHVVLAVEEVLLKQRPIRQVRLDASLREGTISLDGLSAELPGGAAFGATGKASGDGGTLRYAGTLSFRTDRLRTLLDWMEADLSGMADNRPGKAAVAAGVSGDLSQIRFNKVRMQLDAARFDGSATLALRDRPSFDANFKVDRLDLDAWLPAADTGRTEAAAGRCCLQSRLQAAADARQAETAAEVTTPPIAPDAAPDAAPVSRNESPYGSKESPSEPGDDPSATSPTMRGTPPPSESKDRPLAFPESFDANLNVRIGSLGYRKTTIKGLHFDGSLANGRLTIRDAGVRSLAGISARIEGTLSGFEEAPSSEGTPSSGDAASSKGVPSFEGTVTASSDDLSGLFQVLRIEPPLAPGKLGPMRLSARTKAIRDGIAVDAKLELAGAKATVTGSVSDLAKTPAFDLRFDGRHPDLVRLAALFGAGIRKDGTDGSPVALKLSARGNLDAVSVEAEAALAKGTIRLAGTLDTPFDAPRLNVNLGLRHPDLVGLVRVFQPGYAPAGTDLGGLALMAGLKGGGDTVVIEGLEGNVGPTTVAGNGSWHTSGPRPRLKLALTCGVIPLNDYFAPPEPSDPAQRPRTETGGKETSPAVAGAASGLGQAEDDGSEPPADSRRWLAEPIDVTLPALADAEIEVRAETLVYKSFHVERPSIDATLNGRVLRIERLAGTVFDGSLDLAGGLDGRGVPAIDVGIAIKGMNVAKALFQADGFDVATGTLDFGARLNARGRSQRDLVRSLAGSADFKIRNGAVKGFDLHEVSDRLKHPATSAGFIGILGAAMSGGTTRVSSLDGTFIVEKGVIRTGDMKLVADAGAGEAQGVVDLPAWNTDAHAIFRLTGHKDAPPFRLHLTGPLDDPRRRFDFGALEAWVLERSAIGLVETLIFPVPAVTEALTGVLAPDRPRQEDTRKTAPKEAGQDDSDPIGLESFIRGVFGGRR